MLLPYRLNQDTFLMLDWIKIIFTYFFSDYCTSLREVLREREVAKQIASNPFAPSLHLVSLMKWDKRESFRSQSTNNFFFEGERILKYGISGKHNSKVYLQKWRYMYRGRMFNYLYNKGREKIVGRNVENF